MSGQLHRMNICLLVTWLDGMCSVPDTEAAIRTLRHGGAMGHTTVVAAPAGAPLGERFAALSAAAALGERIRDAGGNALVVLDDISCMVCRQPRPNPGCPRKALAKRTWARLKPLHPISAQHKCGRRC